MKTSRAILFILAYLILSKANGQGNLAKYNKAIDLELKRSPICKSDTVIAFGDFCSGCIVGVRKTLFIFYKQGEGGWVSKFELVNGKLRRYVGYPKSENIRALFKFYGSHADDINSKVKLGDAIFNDTIKHANGMIEITGYVSDGPGQFVYIRYGKKRLWNFICCHSIDTYQSRSQTLWKLFSEILTF